MQHHFDSISKKELSRAVSEKTGITRVLALTVVDALLEEIKIQYRAGHRIELRGFGTFIPVMRRARTYKVARLGERDITTPEHTTIRLKPSKQLLIVKG